jgi:glycyl-tRNA synthetase
MSDPEGNELETVAELAKRRGFFFPAVESYGGVAGFYTYGPQGAALKRAIENAWRDRFLTREGHVEIAAPDVMPEEVFEASGHLDGFDDMIIECPGCGESHRADHIVEGNTEIADAEAMSIPDVESLFETYDLSCPSCSESLAGLAIEEFNLMFETSIGPGTGKTGYLRPETAQGIFVEFPRLKEYARGQLPFAVGQIGTAWRNEISPRRALVRVREFTQAELEHFIDPETDTPAIERVADVELTLYPATEQEKADGGYIKMTVQTAVESETVEPWVAYYLGVAQEWYERVGVDMDRFRFRQHLGGELAHYAADCWDAEAELGGNWVEITGFAYRSDYDLTKHGASADEEFTVFRQYDEPKTVERATVDPDMATLGPEYGGAAADIADALNALAATDPEAFNHDPVTVEVGEETYEIAAEATRFSVDTVTESGEHITPHVVEPSFGIGRVVYTVLTHAYATDEVDGEERAYLTLPAEVAPTTVGVFPLMGKDGLDDRAHEVAEMLRDAGFSVTYDESGNIGRRYRRQDEVGTPYCVTVDYESLENDTVTIRERDSTGQTRADIDTLPAKLTSLRAGTMSLGR